ncbi:unnamed protein product, partial [Durusdinium trenchii]
MAGLLRRAARCQAALPLRGSVAKGPIKPIGPNFPIASEKAMGPNGWMRGTYHFWSLSKPFRGSVYQTPWVAGGIHNPTIDPVIHFNTQDRFQTMTAWEFIKCFLYNMLTARVWLVMVAA